MCKAQCLKVTILNQVMIITKAIKAESREGKIWEDVYSSVKDYHHFLMSFFGGENTHKLNNAYHWMWCRRNTTLYFKKNQKKTTHYWQWYFLTLSALFVFAREWRGGHVYLKAVETVWVCCICYFGLTHWLIESPSPFFDSSFTPKIKVLNMSVSGFTIKDTRLASNTRAGSMSSIFVYADKDIHFSVVIVKSRQFYKGY